MTATRDIFASYPVITRIDYAVKARVASVDQIITGWATTHCELTDEDGTNVFDTRVFSVQVPSERLADFADVVLGVADDTVKDDFHDFLLNSDEASSSLPIV